MANAVGCTPSAVPLKVNVAFLVTVTSQPSKAIGTSVLTPETAPLVCNLVALTFGNVTTESFVAATRVQAGAITLPLR